MEEIWKDIKNYEGYYQVSNLGRVRSVDRYIYSKADKYRDGYKKMLKGKILRQNRKLYGYKAIEFNKDNIRKVYYIHRLVAEAFIDNPENKPVINHKDYNPSNNRVDNLEWCTMKENSTYSAERSSHPIKNAKSTSTGYKYITKHGNKYRFYIRIKSIKVNITKEFKTLEEAIMYKKQIFERQDLKEYANRKYVWE